MSITARVTPMWRKQKLLFGVFLLLFGGYFFVDGAFTWPRSNERFRRHQEFAERGDEAGWLAYANEHHWAAKPPEKIHSDWDITGQFIFGGICAAGGIASLLYWLGQTRRTLRMDAEAIYSPTGKKVPFSAITGLGLKRWESKGLARVRYEIEGRAGEFTVDDYKFEAEPCKEMVEEIKRRLEARAAGK